jgi:hypothetical protein
MDLDLSRLRHGEVIVGVGAVVLLASMFAFDWFGVSGQAGHSITGWNALTHVRWLVLVCCICALALVYLQVSRRAPALPVALSVIVNVVGVLTVLALLYRVVINEPGPDSLVSQKPGAFVGLAAAIAIAYGSYASMRQEGIAERDAPREIETIRLSTPGGLHRQGEITPPSS